MKKLFIVSLLMTLFVSNLFAQDIIVKRNAEKIDAIVTEITNDEIKYKKADNQDGPTYVLKKSEVLTIIYKNGTIDTFEASAPQTSAQPAQTQTQAQTQTKTSSNVVLPYIPAFARTAELQRFCPEAYDDCFNDAYSHNTPNSLNGFNLELQSGQDGLTFAVRF